jgi:type IV pilus assembly protein PilE
MNLDHPPHPAIPRRSSVPERGFTLLEMMITVAVIGILAAVAYPSYREYVAKGRRAQATADLLAGHQWMERFYTENLRYDQNSGGTATNGDAGLFATRFPQTPNEGAAVYTPRLSAVAAQSYTITATRAGAATGDRCGNFTINHLGVRGVVNFDTSFANAAAAMAACWRQ